MIATAVPEMADGLSHDELPEGWLRPHLGDVIWPSKARVEPGEKPRSKYLGLEHVEAHTSKILGNGWASDVKSTKSVFRAGDVLYGKLRPYLNKVAVPDFDGVCSTDFVVFDQKPWLNNRFLLWFLLRREVVEYANHHSTGVELPRISYDALASLDFLLPPFAEQERIVGAIEHCVTRIEHASGRLSSVPIILKRFRQAVLAAACSGRLTESWRKQAQFSPDIVDREIAEIRRERQATLMTHATASNAANPDFVCEAPDSWRTLSLDELSVRITSGSRDWKKYYRSDGAGTFIMAQNVRPLFFDRSYRLGVSPPPDDRDRERSRVAAGDVLITIVGANTGDVCRVPEQLEQHYVCQSVALVRPVRAQLSPYLELYLNSLSHGQAQFKEWIYGEGRPHLSFDQLRQTAIVLPSQLEQQEIVRRVQKLFALADLIENRIRMAGIRADKLMLSILMKAFRGELVPTEAELARCEGRDFEPASVLLERSRVQRENESRTSQTQKRKLHRATAHVGL